MSRLTFRDSKGELWIKDAADIDEQGQICMLTDRLAAYEDTGLTPAEIKSLCEKTIDPLRHRANITNGISVGRLIEICAAEREGRCVVLPCKVGDTVYIRRYSLAQKQNIIIEARVAAVKVFRTGFQIDAVTHGGAVNKCEWGRQCFATRAEAEEALKEAQHVNETTT